MSVSLSNVDQTLFDQEVKKKYQSMGFLLRDSVRRRENVEANTVSFRKVQEVIAQEYGFQTQVGYQDPNYNKVNVNLTPYRVATLIDDVERFLYNFDERQEDAQLVAMALGRRSDQIIIDGLSASGTTNVIADGGTGLTFDKIRQTAYYLDRISVPTTDRTLAMTAKAMQQIMNEQEFTNALYFNGDAIRRGTLNGEYAFGFKWVVIPEMAEGGLPTPSANIRTCFAFHKYSMGWGSGRNFSTQIERVAQYDSWQILGKIFAGAVAVDAPGIVAINISEAV